MTQQTASGLFGCKYKGYYIQAQLKGFPIDKKLENHIRLCPECREEKEFFHEQQHTWNRIMRD
jgi:hypothetical protein